MGAELDKFRKELSCPCCGDRNKKQNDSTNKEQQNVEIEKNVLEASIPAPKTAASLRAVPQQQSINQNYMDPIINNSTHNTYIPGTTSLNNNADIISNVSNNRSNNVARGVNSMIGDKCSNCRSRNADCYIMSCNHGLCNHCFDSITTSVQREIVCPMCGSQIIGRTEKRF